MAQEQEKDSSIYDYLYVDRSRLSYALAQLSDDGVLQAAKRISTITGSNAGSIEGGIKVAKGSLTASDGFSEGTDHQFDVSWLLPTNAINVLHDHGYIKRTLKAEIGTIVLLKGSLSIYDLDLITRIWDGFTDFFLARETPKNQVSKQRGEYSLVGKILKGLPPVIQFTLNTEEGEAWSLLNQTDLTMSHHAISLKHGTVVQGEWHVLGIVDAHPDSGKSPIPEGDRMLHKLGPVNDHMRQFLGRPSSAYGVTPLLIFRPCK